MVGYPTALFDWGNAMLGKISPPTGKFQLSFNGCGPADAQLRNCDLASLRKKNFLLNGLFSTRPRHVSVVITLENADRIDGE